MLCELRSKDGVYVNGKNILHTRWIWYPEFSSLRGELYVHLNRKSDESVGDSVDLVIARDGDEVILTDCVLHRRFRCADIWVQIYKGTAQACQDVS
jgi:hypothetical protein